MCCAEHHIGSDEAAATDVTRAIEVSIVEATSQTDLMTGCLQTGLSSIDDASRIDIETPTYLILG